MGNNQGNCKCCEYTFHSNVVSSGLVQDWTMMEGWLSNKTEIPGLQSDGKELRILKERTKCTSRHENQIFQQSCKFSGLKVIQNINAMLLYMYFFYQAPWAKYTEMQESQPIFRSHKSFPVPLYDIVSIMLTIMLLEHGLCIMITQHPSYLSLPWGRNTYIQIWFYPWRNGEQWEIPLLPAITLMFALYTSSTCCNTQKSLFPLSWH